MYSKILTTVTFVLFSQFANAALITDYSVDTSSNVVVDSANNMEWLQWSETVGMSIEDALAAYAADGFFLASSSMMADLFNTFDLAYGNFVWTSDENVTQMYSEPSDGSVELASDREKVFVSLFGNTFLGYSGDNGTTSSNDLEYSGAYFGSDLDGDDLYNFAFVYDDFTVDSNPSNVSESNNRAEIRRDSIFIDGTSPRAGIALVRFVAPTLSSVSSPSVLLVMSLVMFGLISVKRR